MRDIQYWRDRLQRAEDLYKTVSAQLTYQREMLDRLQATIDGMELSEARIFTLEEIEFLMDRFDIALDALEESPDYGKAQRIMNKLETMQRLMEGTGDE